ncbi:hypothetical protein ACFO0M_19110 [Micromonospora mangrovi]|uniref:PknH-like extracellular domain-containing protein n=2 Tax=Micromonospora TaxID=1873 RepID=A0AAU7M379_9ACTN
MRDDDLTFVGLVQQELRSVRWAEPAELRARARRRTRRTTLVAAVAVLLVASAATAVAADRAGGPVGPVAAGGPTGTVAAPATPTPTPSGRAEIPDSALLEAGDLPVKTAGRLGDSGLGEPVRVDARLETCARERQIYLKPTVSRYSRSRTVLRSPGGVPALSQDVYRVDPPWGLGLFGDIDRMVQACPEWRTTAARSLTGRAGSGQLVDRWETAMTDFAGDQSVLLRHAVGEPADLAGDGPAGPAASVDVTLVIRVGDLVTVLVPGPGMIADRVDGTGPGLGYPDLEAIGRRAAASLCPAANPGC